MEFADQFRKRIGEGRPLWGTFLVELLAPGVPRILANAGFDFLMIDCEHGNYSPDQVRTLLDASCAARIAPLVRIPLRCSGAVSQVLDAGAIGILFPMVRTIDDVREAVALTKYPPLGQRGIHMLRPHTGFLPPSDPDDYMRRCNQSLLTVIQIETPEAANLVQSIASTDGVDALYVGPTDLSANFGLLNEPSPPQIAAIMAEVANACDKHGKIAGCHVNTPSAAATLREQGYRLFGYAAASRLLMEGARAFIDTSRREGRSLTIEIASVNAAAIRHGVYRH